MSRSLPGDGLAPLDARMSMGKPMITFADRMIHVLQKQVLIECFYESLWVLLKNIKISIKALLEHTSFECESEDWKIDQQEYADYIHVYISFVMSIIDLVSCLIRST